MMQISAVFTAIWRLVSTDKAKSNLSHVRLDLAGGRAIATDGVIVAEIPVAPTGATVPDALPHDVYLDPRSARAAHKLRRATLTIATDDATRVVVSDGSTSVHVPEQHMPVVYPDTDRVFDAMGAPMAYVAVDPAKLAQLCGVVDATGVSYARMGRRMWLGIARDATALLAMWTPDDCADAPPAGHARAIIMGSNSAGTRPPSWPVHEKWTCDACGRGWTALDGIIAPGGDSWQEVQAAHSCDGIGVVARFERVGDALVLRAEANLEAHSG